MTNEMISKLIVKRRCIVKRDLGLSPAIGAGVAYLAPPADSYVSGRAVLLLDSGELIVTPTRYANEAEMLYYYDHHTRSHFSTVKRKLHDETSRL